MIFFILEINDTIDPLRHEIKGDLVDAGTLFDGKVVECLRPGVVDADNQVIRWKIISILFPSNLLFFLTFFFNLLILRRALIIGGKSSIQHEETPKETSSSESEPPDQNKKMK
jgi:hypothetical protein